MERCCCSLTARDVEIYDSRCELDVLPIGLFPIAKKVWSGTGADFALVPPRNPGPLAKVLDT